MAEYKYEVAISFLAQDEPLANELASLVSDKYSTFIYSKYQEELGGTDGELKFNKVFAEEARTVVVLYRDGWGKSRWTLIEETAIRNRAFNEGWDFVIFIQLDKHSVMPKYLPKAQVWIDLERWGLKGAASVVEHRIAENGGDKYDETIEHKADRLVRERQAKQDRLRYLNSTKAYEDADNEYRKMHQQLKSLQHKLQNAKPSISFGTEEGLDIFELRHKRLRFRIEWVNNDDMRVENAVLAFMIYSIPRIYGGETHVKTERHFEQDYQFDITLGGVIGWSEYPSGENFVTSEKLLTDWVEKFLALVKAQLD